ncbi:MAG: lysylphosphatidylglycerol synthase domain-containing protein, partial [Gaiellaceae bacterium]
MRGVIDALKARRWLLISVEAVAVVLLLGALSWAVRGAWHDAGDRIASASPVDLALAVAWLAAYYLLFVVGWIWILGAWGIRLPYRYALQSEMVSMLAKYIPGGVWTPAARVVAVRRAGITNTPLVLSSVLLEAGLSAVSGVLVFLGGMAAVSGVDTDLVPLIAFGITVTVLLHPAVFGRLAKLVFRPFGGEPPPPLPWRTMLSLIVYYAFTWLIGGTALYFLLRSVGGDPGLETIAFLGGVSAVGAIVAVLAVIAPSGLGVREASMYGLLLAVVPEGVALGAIVLNRLAITIVEGGLLLV